MCIFLHCFDWNVRIFVTFWRLKIHYAYASLLSASLFGQACGETANWIVNSLALQDCHNKRQGRRRTERRLRITSHPAHCRVINSFLLFFSSCFSFVLFCFRARVSAWQMYSESNCYSNYAGSVCACACVCACMLLWQRHQQNWTTTTAAGNKLPNWRHFFFFNFFHKLSDTKGSCLMLYSTRHKCEYLCVACTCTSQSGRPIFGHDLFINIHRKHPPRKVFLSICSSWINCMLLHCTTQVGAH